MNYKKILNPKTGKMISIFSATGRKLLEKYIQYGGHEGPCALNSNGSRCKKSNDWDNINCEISEKGSCRKKKTVKVVHNPEMGEAKEVQVVNNPEMIGEAKVTVDDFRIRTQSQGVHNPEEGEAKVSADVIIRTPSQKDVILVLQSPYDPNNAFDDGDEGLFLIFREIRDYVLVHNKISNMSDIYESLENLGDRRIAHLVIMSHGLKDRLSLSKNDSIKTNSTHIESLADLLRERLLPEASILLHSCLVGEGGPGANNFANAFSKLLPGHVIFGAEKSINRGDLLVLIATKTYRGLDMMYQIDYDRDYVMHQFINQPHDENIDDLPMATNVTRIYDFDYSHNGAYNVPKILLKIRV